jgi:hypothetical protein
MTSTHLDSAKVFHNKGHVVLSSLLRSGGERKETVSIVDASGKLYVYLALDDPVRESRGMLGEVADLMAHKLVKEHAREVALEEAPIHP